MRILFLNDLWDPRIGSSVRLTHQLAAQLRALGHATALVTTTPDAALAGECDLDGLQTFRLLSSYPPRLRSWVSLDNPRVRAGVRAALEVFRPDVVHAHLVHDQLSYASLTAARRAGAAVVFTAHDVMTFCYQKLTCFHGGEEARGARRDYTAYWQKCIPCQRLRWNPLRNARIARVLARDVDRVTAVSHELASALAANGLRVDRVVHNATEPRARLPLLEDVARFRRARGLEDAELVAIGGRLHEQKGVGQLLRMLALLAPKRPRLRLLVLGKREVYEREFEPRARELGVADRVVATGWLDGDELQEALAAVDVFVTPSICFDTFGLVNLEAMEHGKPVVATAFGGSPEVVVDGVTGFVRNPFDVEGFSAAIAALLDDRGLAARLGAAGRERWRSEFLVPRMTAEYLAEYGAARARAGPGPGAQS
ncbi:MAG: glycosyltransferase family 4 protein [Planctomycetes bacterium]|nr:glycosyltransferase family 4 protein [Planctomycetota bacterium]